MSERDIEQFFDAHMTVVADNVDDACAICMDELADGNEICRTACAHLFHSACIRSMVEHLIGAFKSSARCPLCRKCMGQFPGRVRKPTYSGGTRRFGRMPPAAPAPVMHNGRPLPPAPAVNIERPLVNYDGSISAHGTHLNHASRVLVMGLGYDEPSMGSYDVHDVLGSFN